MARKGQKRLGYRFGPMGGWVPLLMDFPNTAPLPPHIPPPCPFYLQELSDLGQRIRGVDGGYGEWEESLLDQGARVCSAAPVHQALCPLVPGLSAGLSVCGPRESPQKSWKREKQTTLGPCWSGRCEGWDEPCPPPPHPSVEMVKEEGLRSARVGFRSPSPGPCFFHTPSHFSAGKGVWRSSLGKWRTTGGGGRGEGGRRGRDARGNPL